MDSRITSLLLLWSDWLLHKCRDVCKCKTSRCLISPYHLHLSMRLIYVTLYVDIVRLLDIFSPLRALSLVLKTFKKLSSERVPSECSKSRYIGELYLLTQKIPSERVPSECSQRRYIGEFYLLSKKPPQSRIVNGHRENNSFINAALP